MDSKYQLESLCILMESIVIDFEGVIKEKAIEVIGDKEGAQHFLHLVTYTLDLYTREFDRIIEECQFQEYNVEVGKLSLEIFSSMSRLEKVKEEASNIKF